MLSGRHFRRHSISVAGSVFWPSYWPRKSTNCSGSTSPKPPSSGLDNGQRRSQISSSNRPIFSIAEGPRSPLRPRAVGRYAVLPLAARQRDAKRDCAAGRRSPPARGSVCAGEPLFFSCRLRLASLAAHPLGVRAVSSLPLRLRAAQAVLPGEPADRAGGLGRCRRFHFRAMRAKLPTIDVALRRPRRRAVSGRSGPVLDEAGKGRTVGQGPQAAGLELHSHSWAEQRSQFLLGAVTRRKSVRAVRFSRRRMAIELG